MQTISVQAGTHKAEFVGGAGWVQEHPLLTSLIILVCALSLRLFFTYRAEPTRLVFPDSGTYFDTAVSLSESGTFFNRYQKPEITRTPGYPFFLAALMTVCGKDVRTLLLVQTVILSLSVVVLYWLARCILPPTMAFTGAVLAAVSPWGAARAGFLLSDGLFLTALAVLFLLMYTVIRSARTSGAVLAGASAIGLLTSGVVFIRPVFPLIGLVAVTMFLLYPEKRIRAWLLVTVMLLCALVPLQMWKMRNAEQAQFSGFSDVSGKAAWQWWASSVKGQVAGLQGDRWAMLRAAEEAETQWTFSPQEAHDERWRLANEVFRAHPFSTLYVFGLNALEALIHPQANILTPAALNFPGDTIALGVYWMAIVFCAAIGGWHIWGRGQATDSIDRKWILTMLIICLAITLTAGVSFGAGARYRIALELIVPLLAGVGLVRIVTAFREQRRLMWRDAHPLNAHRLH